MAAAFAGHEQCIRALPEANADVDAVDESGDNALTRICKNTLDHDFNRAGCVRLLLEYGGSRIYFVRQDYVKAKLFGREQRILHLLALVKGRTNRPTPTTPMTEA